MSLPGTAGTAGPAAEEPLALTGAHLTIVDVEAVARHGRTAPWTPRPGRAWRRPAPPSSAWSGGEVVYGVTTGFGALAGVRVPPAQARELQERLLRSHAAGVGEPLPREVVRAMLLLRANTLALGHSGCRPGAHRPAVRDLAPASIRWSRAGQRGRLRRPGAPRPPGAAHHRRAAIVELDGEVMPPPRRLARRASSPWPWSPRRGSRSSTGRR